MAQLPEQKAKEIFDKMFTRIGGEYGNPYDREAPKQCALIAVDEMIKTHEKINAMCTISAGSHWYMEHLKELNQTKEAILKL